MSRKALSPLRTATSSSKCLYAYIKISGIYLISSTLSPGTKKCLYPSLYAERTDGSTHETAFIVPSSHSSPINILVAHNHLTDELDGHSRMKRAVARARSNLVHDFLRSEGERFKIILRGGIATQIRLNTDFILSFDSLIAWSGSHIISMPGKALV